MADNVDIVRDAPHLPPNAPDPNVKLPPSVAAAARAAEAAHKAAYSDQEVRPQPDNQVQEVRPQPDNPVQPVVPQGDPKTTERATWTQEQWVQHAKSMEGRYNQQKQIITGMQDQMSQLGDELLRSQSAPRQPQQQVKPVEPVRIVTEQDQEAYGQDMIDFAKRAALEAVEPTLQDLRNQNIRLQKQVFSTVVTSVNSVLDQQVPNWRDINTSTEFQSWLRLRDIYSGAIRSDLLKAAHRAADAARVVAFFKGYLDETAATGELDTLPSEQPSLLATPRQAAVPLNTLTAPGHARPPTGSTVGPDAGSKPTITHAQIAQFYNNVRLAVMGKGPYAGRDADRLNDEAFVYECQREGRVR